MLIQTDRLKSGPLQIEINVAASEFPALNELLAQESVSIEGPVVGNVRVFRAARIIEAEGHVAAQLVSACGRCLAPVETTLSVPFTLSYVEHQGSRETETAEEVELNEDDLGLISYEGKEIDLRHDIDQELVMAIPLQLLCDDRCKGLCPSCGQNLNQAQCSCEAPVFHPGLAALKNLKIE